MIGTIRNRQLLSTRRKSDEENQAHAERRHRTKGKKSEQRSDAITRTVS
jgi:hypothetical protein